MSQRVRSRSALHHSFLRRLRDFFLLLEKYFYFALFLETKLWFLLLLPYLLGGHRRRNAFGRLLNPTKHHSVRLFSLHPELGLFLVFVKSVDPSRVLPDRL